jgi:hypothetical protein
MLDKNNESDYHYRIILTYEVPYNVLESTEPDKLSARETLYERLSSLVSEDRYDKFFVKLSMYQRKDSFNYLITFEAYFLSTVGLPMEEYVEASKIKEAAKKELEEYFNSMDCDFKQINLKILL